MEELLLKLKMDARQVRNALGIYDDDLLNAACGAMEREEMESKVWRVMSKHMKRDPGEKRVFRFFSFHTEPLFRELNDKFGFEWKASDEEYQKWVLTNGTFDLFIYPVWYYERPGEHFSMYNYHIVQSDWFL